MTYIPVHSAMENYFGGITEIQVPIAAAQAEFQAGCKDKLNPYEALHRTNKSLGRNIQRYKRIIGRYEKGVREEGEEEEEFRKKYEKAYARATGDLADLKKQLAELNLPLVVSIAKGYNGKRLSQGDLIGEGNLGLMKATDHYDPDFKKEEYPNGIEFATYAKLWIEESINRALYGELRGKLPIPYKICSNRGRINSIISQLEEKLRREPTNEEVASEFNETFYPEGPRNSLIDAGHVEGLKMAVKTPKRISRRNGNEDYEYIDSESQTPYEKAEHKEQLERMLGLLGNLDEREEKIIRSRYGLNGEEPKTLKQIGNEIGLTRERVRQIENKAMEKLREQISLKKRAAA